MKSVNIKLNLMTDGASSSRSLARIRMTWICAAANHVVDAKSILGIFSLTNSLMKLLRRCA